MAATNDDSGVIVGANSLLRTGLGSDLSVTSNTITITDRVHYLTGSGTINTISVSGGNPSGSTDVILIRKTGSTVIFSTSGGNITGITPDIKDNELILGVYDGTNWTLSTSSTTGLGPTRGYVAAYDISKMATSGDGSADNPWSGWETALNALAANAYIFVPAGQYTQTAIVTVKAGWRIEGAGRTSTVITSTFVGTAFRTAFTLNSSTAANVSISGIGFTNTNAAPTGSAFLEVGGTFVRIEKCRFIGFRYGVAMVQTELCDIIECDFELQKRGGVWRVNGGDYNLTYADIDLSGASGGFTNRISIQRCQFNMGATGVCIIDDGGYPISVRDCNFNGGASALYIAGVFAGEYVSNEFESQSSMVIHVAAVSYNSGTGVGGSQGLVFMANIITPIAGQHAWWVDSAGTITLSQNIISSTVTAFVGAANTGQINVFGMVQNGAGALFDTVSTRHFQIDGAVGLTTNLPFAIKTGRLGGIALVAGTATVANTGVTASTRVFINRRIVGGTPGFLSYTVSAGVGFTITSSNAADTSVVDYVMFDEV